VVDIRVFEWYNLGGLSANYLEFLGRLDYPLGANLMHQEEFIMEADTIFGKIIRREIPATIVYETETVLAFKDIYPQAPTHILIIPKKSISSVSAAKEQDRDVLGELLLAAAKIAEQVGVSKSGYRLVVNNGRDAGQAVDHLHVHLLGGRELQWPPG
jgi:histidine triad (HIT) family protein